MSEQKTNCSSCGCKILLRTAARNDGLCEICHREVTYPAEKIITPVRPVSRAMLDELIIFRPPNVVIDALFEPACDKVNFRPWEMTEGDIIVYTVCTFNGETCNGGIVQYLSNQSGGWAHHCGLSLRKIGADKYADVIEKCIRVFTDATFPHEEKWQSDLDTYCDAHDRPFEEFELPLWSYYKRDSDELTNLLYDYICKNRDLFAPFTMC